MAARLIVVLLGAVEWLAALLGVTTPTAAVIGGLFGGVVPAGLAGKLWGSHVDAPAAVTQPWQAPKPRRAEACPPVEPRRAPPRVPNLQDFLPSGWGR